MRICALLILLLAGCNDNQYRYFCQNPDNFNASQCQKPRCEFDQDCPEYLIAPVLEKKIEGNPVTPTNPQPQSGATNCR
jgi:hypothetical protein